MVRYPNYVSTESIRVDRPLLRRAGSYPRVAARLARQVEVALGQVELSLPQYRILILLDEGPAVASRLAEYLVVSRPTITAVVDGLVSRGLIVRSHDDGDRRRIGLTLTAAGRDALELADRSVQARLQEVARHLDDPAQAEAALAGLDVWMQALDAHRAAHRKSKQ
jgi:long-chain acyl-CoA synthetase